MTKDAYFYTPEDAISQVLIDIGLSDMANRLSASVVNGPCSPLEAIVNSTRCVATLFIGSLPNFVVQTGVGFADSFVDIQFHPPHAGSPGDQGTLAHFHVREASRNDHRTPDSNQGTDIQIRDSSTLRIRHSRTKPGCKDHYFIRNPGKNQPRKRKEFQKFTEILSKLLNKCYLPATIWNFFTSGQAAQTLADNVMRDVQATWKREEHYFVPDAQWKVSLALKAVVPGAVAAQVVNRAAEKALVQVGKNLGVKVVGKGVGQGLGKAVGGVGSFAGLATDIALETIPGAKEAVGEGGRIGIGFAASAGAGAMVAGPVGLAVGVVGYGIGEGISQLVKLF